MSNEFDSDELTPVEIPAKKHNESLLEHVQILSRSSDARGILLRLGKSGYTNEYIKSLRRRVVILSETDPDIATIMLMVLDIAAQTHTTNALPGGVLLQAPLVP